MQLCEKKTIWKKNYQFAEEYVSPQVVCIS